MRWLQLTLALLCSVLFFSCMRDRESVVLLDDVAYVRFIGSIEGVSVAIDNAPPVELVASRAGDVLYEIQPGRHMVVLIRDEMEILRRDIYVARGQVFDMRVPR